MIGFTKRNLLIFFKDKSAVFFSLLSSFIIIGLYILFLGEVWVTSFSSIENARDIMDNWVMAGLVAITSATTSVGALAIMVNDRATKIDRDLYVSPVSRRSIAGGYMLSAFIVGFIMSVITLGLAELYIVSNGGTLLSPAALLRVLALILVADLANTSMMFFMTTFFTSNNAFSAATTIIGTLIGFITGIYIPIGSMPEAVQWLIKLFPVSHAAVLMRQVMMKEPMESGLTGMPQEFIGGFKEMLGVVFKVGDAELSTAVSMIVLLGSAVIFFILSVLVLSKKKK